MEGREDSGAVVMGFLYWSPRWGPVMGGEKGGGDDELCYLSFTLIQDQAECYENRAQSSPACFYVGSGLAITSHYAILPHIFCRDSLRLADTHRTESCNIFLVLELEHGTDT
jgi:hypothetical protein